MSWTVDAACAAPDVNPDWFDVCEPGQLPILAMRTCIGCPVRMDCFNDAMSHRSWDSGIWGGTTERNRRHVRSGAMTVGRAMALGNQIAQELTATEKTVRNESAKREKETA